MKQLLSSLFLLLFCCCDSVGNKTRTEDWRTYSNSEHGYTATYPGGWEQSVKQGAIVFTSPKETETDDFLENVNILVQDLSSSPMNLEQYTELTRKQINDYAGPQALLSLKGAVLAGKPCMECMYEMKYNDRNLKFKQYWFILDNQAYLFTYTAEPASFSKYEATATRIMKSFKFAK
jgi:hypothetical protein